MWFNTKKTTKSAFNSYQLSVTRSCPNHVVIDGLFDLAMVSAVSKVLQDNAGWQTQRHTYTSLYVEGDQWQSNRDDNHFVQRSAWQRSKMDLSVADLFLQFLRSDEFMAFLSSIFNVALTDKNVEDPSINTNYFRLGKHDFVRQHADDSPGREVCMLLYLNNNWQDANGGELVFLGDKNPVKIAPRYNRCVLFNPSSQGSEHSVADISKEFNGYRYNLTSWYWSE